MTPHEQHAHFRRSRNEAAVIVAIFVVVMAVVIGACASAGYREDDCIRARGAGIVVYAIAPNPDDPSDSSGMVRTEPQGARLAPHWDGYAIPGGYRLTVHPYQPGFLAPPGEQVRAGQVLARPIDAPPPATLLGLPAWVALGVFAPWALCIGITGWFGFCYMSDQPTVETAAATPVIEQEQTPAYRVEPTEGK
jgi:hypothetical protein